MIRYLRSFLDRKSFGQMAKVGVIGVLNTVSTLVLLNVFQLFGWTPLWSVTWAFAITTFASYVLNRIWTFALEGSVSGKETAAFYAVNIAAWAATASGMWAADRLFGPLGQLQANLVYLAIGFLILLPKLASYRDVVFTAALRAAPDAEEPLPAVE